MAVSRQTLVVDGDRLSIYVVRDLSEEAVAAVEIIVSQTTFFEIKSVQ